MLKPLYRSLLAAAFFALPQVVLAQQTDWTGTGVQTTTLDVVGIGTTSPNAPYKLHVLGNTNNFAILSDSPSGYAAFGARLPGRTYGWYLIPVTNNSSAYTDLEFGEWDTPAGTGGPKMTLTSSGSVGIDTTLPDAKLHIFGDGGNAFKVTTVNSTYPLLLHDTLSSEGYPNGIVADFQGNSLIRVSNLQLGYLGSPVVQSMGSNPLYLNRGSSNDVVVGQSAYTNHGFRVESTGNSSFAGSLSIGTTTPAGLLHVAGNTQLDGNLTLNGNLITGGSSSSISVTATGVSSNGASGIANVSGANTAGTAAAYYGGGAQSAYTAGVWVNGPSNGDGSPYTYGAEGGTTTAYYGGKAGGYFKGGDGVTYAGGGVGLMAIGGNTPAGSGSSAHGGAGLYACGGTNADSSPSWAAWFAGNTMTTGSVGIGTTTPDATHALHVVGNVQIDGTLTGTNIQAQYQDVAEWVPASEAMTAGTVVVLNGSKSNEVIPSFRAYDTTVAGVVSARPGVILGSASPSKAQIATTGRVRVKVDATKHPIAIGDLLVTSDKPGMAMVSEPLDLGGVKIHRPGTLIGKALEPLPGGEGEILVLLSLQ